MALIADHPAVPLYTALVALFFFLLRSPCFAIFQQALQRVKNSFRGSLEVDVDMAQEEDSDDDLMATATRLSLRCPLGLVRWSSQPGRL